MSIIKTGGSLFQLPQEVRDEIYSHYFNKEYLVFWSYCDYEDFDVILIDLAILRTSHAISADAKNSLFSRAVSESTSFIYDFGFDPVAQRSTPPTKEATTRMMNVEFRVLIEPQLMASRAMVGGYADNESLYPASSMDAICEATIDHFTGMSVIRDRFRIRFRVLGVEYYDHFLEFTKTRFFQELNRTQGLRKLSLVVEIINLFKDDVSIEEQEDVGEVVAELEPHLGPCVAKSLTHDRWKEWLYLAYDLEFHPLKWQMERVQVETANLTKDVKNSRDGFSEPAVALVVKKRTYKSN